MCSVLVPAWRHAVGHVGYGQLPDSAGLDLLSSTMTMQACGRDIFSVENA